MEGDWARELGYNIGMLAIHAWGIFLGVFGGSVVVAGIANAMKNHSLSGGRTFLTISFLGLIYFSLFVADPSAGASLPSSASASGIAGQLGLAATVGIPYVVLGFIFTLFTARSKQSTDIAPAEREGDRRHGSAETELETRARIRREEEYRLQVRRELEEGAPTRTATFPDELEDNQVRRLHAEELKRRGYDANGWKDATVATLRRELRQWANEK